MEGANTINRAVVMGEFTSNLNRSRKKVEISNVQTANVNTDQTEDKVDSDLLGHRWLIEAMIFSKSVVHDNITFNLLECVVVEASNISKSLVQDSSH